MTTRKIVLSKAAWPVGAALATALLLCAFLLSDVRFANNDDTYILRMMMGYGGAEGLSFNMCLHFLWVAPLRWLAAAFPGVPWFSYLQLALLWLSAAVAAKSLIRLSSGLWRGALFAALFLLAFFFAYACRVTFTVTAALLGAAAVLQLLSIQKEDRPFGPLLGGATLLVFAYGLRQITALPLLAYCGLAALWLFFRTERRKAVIAGVLIALVLLGGFCGLRELEIDQKGARPYLNWQTQSGRALDFHSFGGAPKELLAQTGWSDGQIAMIKDWYFMDDSVTAERFQALADGMDAAEAKGPAAFLSRAFSKLASFAASEPVAARSLWLLLFLWLGCAVGSAIKRDGKRLFLLALAFVLFAGMTLYLAAGGRLPLRAMLMCALPMAGLVCGLLPGCLPQSRALRGALALCAAGLLLWYAVPTVSSLQKAEADPNAEAVDAYRALDEFAVDNPELLLVYDNSLVGDLRMFPDASYGIPTNVCYWGGWGTHSPEYQARLRAFGFANWDASSFLNENVRLMRGMIDPPPVKLLAYLREATGNEALDAWLDSESGGVYAFILGE